MKPDYLSHSQIATLDKCGMQYHYRYVEGIKSPPGIAMLKGTATHAAIEANMRAKLETGAPLPSEAIRDAAADAFTAATRAGEYVLDGDYAEMSASDALASGKDGAVGLAELHAAQVAPLIEPTGVEMRVRLPESEALPVVLFGVVDLVDRGQIVRDTKTSKKSPAKDSADSSMQLSAYALLYAGLNDGRLPAKLTLDYLVETPGGKRSSTVQETTRGWEDVRAFVARANAALRVIEAETFLPAPADSWVCSPKWCGYWDRCPFGAAGRSTRARMAPSASE